jgi:hypothetical protein
MIFFSMRAQYRLETPPSFNIEENEEAMGPITAEEIRHCAAVIVAAFLNPSKPY